MSVCLSPINVKTAEPIEPKFFVGHHVTTGKVYEWSKFQIFVSIKIRSSLNFLKFWKSTKFFVKIRELFLFCFTMYTKRTLFTINLEDGREVPWISSNIYFCFKHNILLISCLLLKSSLSMNCPVYEKSTVYEMSCLWKIWSVYEMSCLWKVYSVYEMSCFWISFFMKCPIYEMSYLCISFSMKCPSMYLSLPGVGKYGFREDNVLQEHD